MPTAADGGDADAWRWHNENDAMNMNARESVDRRVSLEEKRVGTSVVSFEELLARELEKSQQEQDANTLEARSGSGARRSNVQKKPFLKKGDRGWWMQRPDIKAKMSKHVLVSKDIDGAESSSSKATTAAASASMRSSTQQSLLKKSSRLSLERQRSQASNVSDRRRRMEPRSQHAQLPPPPPLSPPIRRKQEIPERRQPSPPPPPPAPVRQSYSDYDHHQIIDTQPAPRLSDSMRTTTSVDTLGMSRVRQSYEAQLEREADELADFEAIERELAAEKDLYLMEKQQYHHEQVNDDFEPRPAPLWHFSSGSQSHQRPSQRETSFQSFDAEYEGGNDGENLELDGHSSLLFDDDQQSSPHGKDKFEPTSQFSSDRRRISDHFATSRHPYAASELSAISLNDSESWDDHLSQQLYQPRAGSLSPISKRGSASRLLDAAQNDFGNGYGSFGSNATNPAHQSSVRRASDAFSEDIYGYNATGGSPANECKPARDEPPVSALMQQFFGGNQGSSSAGAEDDEQHDTSHDSDYNQDEIDGEQQSAARSQGKNRRDGEEEPDNSLSALRAKLQPKPSNNSSSLGKTTVSKNQPASDRRAKPKTAPVSARNTAKSVPSKQQSNPPSSKTQTGPVLPVVIEEKLFELEEEVKFYKAETLQLQKKKDFFDQAAKKLAKEREEFARFQSEQGVLIEKEWEKERLKMKREEKLMERQIKLKLNAAASHHDRKERGEIEALKAQIVKMQLDEKARAGKWKAMNDNLRQRVGELEDKNRELSEEIKFLERDRLEQWGKYEALLKEKQRPSEPATRSYNSSHSHFDLDAEREIRTMNDLFAIKDTAEELLKGWQDREEADAVVQSTNSTKEAVMGEYSRGSPPLFSARQSQSSASRSNYSQTRFGKSGGWQDPAQRTSFPDLASSPSSRSTSGSMKKSDGDEGEPNADTATVLSSSRSALESNEPKRIKEEVVQPGGKRELIYTDGSKKIFFADGNEKEIDANGHTTIKFTNGDRKELFPDTGISIYYYYEAQTTLTTYPDKIKVYEFPNQQVEKSFPDGTTEISFADGIKKTIRPNGDEFSVFPDGTTMLEQKDGLREVTLLNQKKIRYYPNGKMAWVTPQGKETLVRSDAELKKLMESL